MLVLVSASGDFFHKWDDVVGLSGSVVHVGSIRQLKEFLSANAASLVVLDMTLEGGRDPDVLRSISAVKKQARLVLSGIQFSPSSELFGLAVGAVACCSSSLSAEESRKILDVVRRGGVWLSGAGIPALVERLYEFSARTVGLDTEKGKESKEGGEKKGMLPDNLTSRERTVATLVGNGASNKDIARELHISESTVKSHLSVIFSKLQVRDRVQLALLVSGSQAIKSSRG